MREILFRGKRIETGEWVYGNPFVSNTDARTYILYGSRRVTIGWEVDPSTFGQYTGMIDNNGNRIFEGDILSIWNDRNDVVVFEDGAFIMEDTEIPMRFAIKFDVIGNVHDNPELLEK